MGRPLCGDEGGHRQFLGRAGATPRSVAPGAIWTPLIPSTMPEGASEVFRPECAARPRGPGCRTGAGLRSFGFA